MKNLKKVLALVLAMSTVFGLSVSAGAAATDFNDYDEIQNKEAVEVMNALNVIGGNNNGDFNPDGYLTRAEMCKMVSFVMNGGKAPVLSTSATPTYSDIKGHWGEAYVEYATSMGIVGGVGGGKFSPDSSLTGTQAAKMMLTAMGYDATVFGFGGTGWDLNVNRYANEAGLYKNLSDLQPNLPITRDQAAQLMYNAIQATMMHKEWTLNPATGEKTEIYTPWQITQNDGTVTPVTLLSEKYDGAIKIGYMSDFSYDSVKKEWTYTFDNSGNTFGGRAITAQNAIPNNTNQKSDVDYTGFFGQQVKVIYNTDDENVTYGVYANDSSVVVEGATGNVEDYNDNADTVTVSGKDYKLNNDADTIPVYNFGVPAQVATLDSLKPLADGTNLDAYTVKLVDNNGDGKIDAAIKTPMTIAKINYVGKDTVQLGSNLGSVKLDSLVTYDGYAAGDWVGYISSANAVYSDNTLVKMELKTGTVDSVRGGANANVYTQYKLADSWLTGSRHATYNGNVIKADVNDTIEYVSLGSTIFYSKITDIAATTKNIAMIVTAGVENGNNGGNLSGNDLQAKLLFGDGTTKTVSISKVNGNPVTTAFEGSLQDMIGTLVTYRVDGSNYELMTVQNDSVAGDNTDDSNLAGYKEYVTRNAGYSNGKINGIELADDAVVYYIGNYGAGATEEHSGNVGHHPGDTSNTNDDGIFGATSTRKADVYTGKEIKNTWGTGSKTISDGIVGTAAGNCGDLDTVDYTAVLTQEINGFTYAKVVIIRDETGLPTITAGSNYGYLSAQTGREVKDGKTYLKYTIHTADGEFTAVEENTDAPNLYPQGAVITYDVVSDGVIKNVNIAKVTTGKVTGWDGESKIALDGTSTEIDSKDTTVIYVDSQKMVGVEGGSIQKFADYNGNGVEDANEPDNVRYVMAADYVVMLLVDVNNDMKANPAKTSATVTDAAGLVDALKYDQNVTVSGSFSATNVDLNGNTLTVNTPDVLTITGDLNLNGGTLTGTGTVTVRGETVMGSTLSISNFTTASASVASGKTMNITGGNVSLGTVTGSGKLNVTGGTVTATNVTADIAVSGGSVNAANVTGNVTVSNAANVTVSGTVTGNLTVNAGATGTVNAGAVTGTVTNNSDTGITVGDKPVYKNGQDVKVRAFNVVK